MLKRQLCGRRKAAKKFIEFLVSATVVPNSLPETISMCQEALLAWPQENLGARLKLKLAEPTGPG